MTTANMEIILGAVADAARNQDSAPLTALLDEHVVWEGVHPDQRCDGRHQAMQIISGFFAQHRLTFDAVEVVARGDMVVVGLHGPGFNGTPEDTETVGQLFHVLTLRDGVVRRWKSYLNRDEAFAAVGELPGANRRTDADGAWVRMWSEFLIFATIRLRGDDGSRGCRAVHELDAC